MKLVFALLLSCAGLAAQSCVINGLSGQAFLTPQPIQLTATVTSAPTAYKLIWTVDHMRWATGFVRPDPGLVNDFRDGWQGPFTVTWYTALNGDGPHTVSGVVDDIFGNQIATCPGVSFLVNVMGMSSQSITSAPTSGSSTAFNFATFDGNDASIASVDGVTLNQNSSSPLPFNSYPATTSITGGWTIPNFRTTQWTNASHLLQAGYSPLNLINDPYLLGSTFSGSVSGSTITTVAKHYATEGGELTFSSSGTLPSPLVTGCQYYSGSATSLVANYIPSSNIVTYTISGGLINLTISSGSGCTPTSGEPVFIRNIPYTSSAGVNACDGYFTMLASPTPTSTTFSVTAPAGCPNGIVGHNAFEVLINPYFAHWISASTLSVSSSPGGSQITLSGGSGTHTITQRIRSVYWGLGDKFNQAANEDQSAPANVYQVVTFANGNAPMEIEVPYWELHMVAGGSPVSICPQVKNTDLSFSSPGCTAFTYTVVSDGGLSGVVTASSSGSITPVMAGWSQIQVGCPACAAGGVSLPTVTVYAQVQTGSVTFPHFTHNGTIATAFSPGNSFFPLSTWQMGIIFATNFFSSNGHNQTWWGPMMQEANLNSSMITADLSGVAFGDPQTNSCYSSSWPSTNHQAESAFAAQYGTYFEVDITSTAFGQGGPGFLAAFLNNTGYNRQSCFAGFLGNLVSEGRTWRTFGRDELNQYMAGSVPFRNPNLGSTDFPTIVVSSGVATYNVAETFTGTWSQTTGLGSWIKMAGAVTNTCLNGWFPVTSIASNPAGGNWLVSTSFTTYSPCPDGTYTEATAQLYHYWVGAGIGENVISLPRFNGSGNDNNNIDSQAWDGSAFTQIVVSSGVAEFYMPGNKISNGQAIRVHGSVNNLNTVKPITVIDADHFTISYNSALETTPSNNTYNSGNDAALFVSVDGNFPPTPFLSLRNVLTGITGHPATTWPAIGFTYSISGGVPNPGVFGWAGNSIGEDAAFDYIPSPPTAIYGSDAGVWGWANYAQSTSGLATRGFQLQPRSMLWAAGLNYVPFCHGLTFNPACDHPTQLLWRPETLVAQMMAMLMLNVSALRLYNFAGNPSLDFGNCCGWNAPGTGTGAGISPINSPKQWAAMAHVDALIKLREDTELQPPANKPYYGPMFLTDAHTSSTYGNELKILCESEMPYVPAGSTMTVNLPTIAGGTVLKYILTGYGLSVTQLSGNPTTDSDEYCSRPGRTTVYVAQPPGVNVMDNRHFSAPASLPFGASKFLIQVGYYPRAMQFDPVTDCSSGCVIPIDHHNTAAWYRTIYADSNNLPLSIGDPVQIPSQGLF